MCAIGMCANGTLPFKYSLSREQIVTINRIRSNHYNLNYSLFKKNIIESAACPCGDGWAPIAHIADWLI